jgi:hypothetical protein
MMKLLFIFTTFSLTAYAQGDFAFGKITYDELNMSAYFADSTVEALVLKEFGEAHIDNADPYNLVFKYHTKYKILKANAASRADYSINLYKDGDNKEFIRKIKASSFNIVNGSILETSLNNKNIYSSEDSKHWSSSRFAIPGVTVGSVVEVEYEIESPFIYNFRTWEFQSDIPKLSSEFWARIPGNYVYNISIRGFLKLSKEENDVEKDCFNIGSGHADCLVLKYAMTNIPALKEEEFMLAKSNYLSSINFELSQIKYFDGRVQKFTEEWSDAENKLNHDEKFGVQLKRGKDITSQIEPLLISTDDEITRARKVFNFIKAWYSWNGVYGKYSEFGIRKAFDNKKGNVGDINLSLVAALRFAGFTTEPVILSTRENGMPREIHPVLSDFNYVIAKITIGDKQYLLDATEDVYPFGVLPERCLNGKGRALGENESYWIEMKSSQKRKRISSVALKVNENGDMEGTMQNTYIGYEAIRVRKEIFSTSKNEYIDGIAKKYPALEIVSTELQNEDEIEKSVTEKIFFKISGDSQNTMIINPFLAAHWEANPFKASERIYPVDFGVPIDEINTFSIEIPENYEVENIPENIGLALPNAGGRLMLASTIAGSKLSMSSAFQINKLVFTAEEYHYLRELFSLLLKMQSADLLVKKRL